MSVFIAGYWQNNYQIERVQELIKKLDIIPLNKLENFLVKQEDEFKEQTYWPTQKEKELIDKAEGFWIIQGKINYLGTRGPLPPIISLEGFVKTYNLLQYAKKSKKPIKYYTINNSSIHVGQGHEVKEGEIFTEDYIKEIKEFQSLLHNLIKTSKQSLKVSANRNI